MASNSTSAAAANLPTDERVTLTIGIMAMMMIIGLLLLGMRLYVRIFVTRTLGPDDYVITFAYVS
jgi:hypothetical protein